MERLGQRIIFATVTVQQAQTGIKTDALAIGALQLCNGVVVVAGLAADLAGQVMLEDVPDSPEDPSNWVVWAREAGVKLPQFSRKRRFGQANLVVQAAVNGLGVAMGRSTLVEALVDEGKLVQPFPENVRSQYAYWFVCRHDALARRNVRAFRDWLQSSVSEMD